MHWIDPNYLPEVTGVVDCFLLNGEGETDGLVLADGVEIHFPPRMGHAVLDAVRPGATVRIRGVRPRGVAMIVAVSIASEGCGRIVDAGPREDDEARKARRKQTHAARSAMEARGVVRQALHGPKGEVRGLLLEDGRTGRFPPDAADSLAMLLASGKAVLLRGDGLSTPLGTVITIHEVGTSADDVRVLKTQKPHLKKHGDKPCTEHASGRHGPHAPKP
jgi:hypothetical protein